MTLGEVHLGATPKSYQAVGEGHPRGVSLSCGNGHLNGRVARCVSGAKEPHKASQDAKFVVLNGTTCCLLGSASLFWTQIFEILFDYDE